MQRMKAWVYRPVELSEAPLIRLEEVDIPLPESGDLLIRVQHTSACGTDESLFSGRRIRTVASRADLQNLLMKPVTVLGPFDRLGELMLGWPAHLLKAAFEPFESQEQENLA